MIRIIASLLLGSLAFKNTSANIDDSDINTLHIIYNAAKKYNVDASDMIKIAYVESKFNPSAFNKNNKNGTVDIGLFQINSIHWTTTCKDYDVFSVKGNSMCAAKILSNIKKRHALDDKNWVARYHSSTHSKKYAYAELLKKARH